MDIKLGRSTMMQVRLNLMLKKSEIIPAYPKSKLDKRLEAIARGRT